MFVVCVCVRVVPSCIVNVVYKMDISSAYFFLVWVNNTILFPSQIAFDIKELVDGNGSVVI